MVEQKLLSICIPTYNRAKFLKSSLLSIYDQIDDYKDFEVIVSDNASTDNTEQVVAEYLHKINFRYIKQSKNVGAARNYLTLVSNASSEFCWIVGDDDFILPNRIANIIYLIKKSNADFFYAKVDHLNINDYWQYLRPFSTSVLAASDFSYQDLGKWEDLLQPKYSIIFLGEVMASIFRRSIWLSYVPEGLDEPFLSNLETTYTHSVIFANTFVGKKAVYIDSPTIIALDGAREWWSKVGFIILVHVRNLLKLYKSKGVSDDIMQVCWNAYISLSVPYAVEFIFNPKIDYRSKVSLKEYYKEMLALNKGLFFREIKTQVKEYLKRRYQYYKDAVKTKVKKKIGYKQPLPKDYDLNLKIFQKNQVKIGLDFKISGKIQINNIGTIIIGSGFQANAGQDYNPIGGDTNLRLVVERKNAILTIGSNVGISNSTLVCWNQITIEDNVMIGGGSRIWDTNFHSLNSEIRVSGYDDDVHTKPVLIRRNAFIGGGSIILKGVTIGRNSIIAAGSVVTKDIPDNVIAGGNPCKVIRNL